MQKSIEFVPELSTPAGSCLTSENWQESGIKTVSYSLSALLIKPGLACLNKLPNLAHYLAWPGKLILDASMLNVNSDGYYRLRSSFDGSTFQFTSTQLFELMNQLQPDAIVLPTDYFEIDSVVSNSILLLQTIPAVFELPFFTAAWFTDHGMYYLRSNQPANDAYQGLLYHPNGHFSIQDESEMTRLEVIDAKCRCKTCEQGFTRAYLHHLFKQTPLLCQRLLIQHNVYAVYAALKSRYDVTHYR